ncbi:MAG: hypothetical protein DI611_11345 [Brachybacterium faecium]|nr:MAG: hypothetical protein DI611_11345 [Brachybacterium faecium]
MSALRAMLIPMKATKLLSMSNREVEDRAIAFVIAHERAAGRTATDTRGTRGAQVDVISVDDTAGHEHHIEVKAYGGSGRGADLWLEPVQVEVLESVANPHLYIVTDVRSPDPIAMRILDLTGDELRICLEKERPKLYFEIPLPTAVYDQLARGAAAHSDGAAASGG